MHQLERLASDDTLAVEFSAIGQHLGKAEIIADRAEQAMASPCEHVRRINRIGLRNVEPVVEALHPGRELAAHGHAGVEYVRAAVHRRHAAPLLRGHAKRRIGHAQGLEQPLPQEHSERLTCDDFDHPSCDVDADAVAPARPGLERERIPRQIVNNDFQRMVRAQQLSPLGIHFADARFLDKMVREPLICVIKSRTRIGRTGATSFPSASRTFTAPKAGMYFATGSISRKRPSSSSVMSAVQTIGFVIE